MFKCSCLAILVLLMSVAIPCRGQQYPADWSKYTMGGYLYDIQSDINIKGLSETVFKENLLNLARTNLAKQIEVDINDKATMKKTAVDGKTTVSYFSQTQFSTDVALHLAETRSSYDAKSRQGYVIAFIDKALALRYWSNEINVVLSQIQNHLSVAEAYLSTGFKDKARGELDAALEKLSKADEPLAWLSVFDMSASELTDISNRRNNLEITIKSSLAELEYGTAICVICNADVFGLEYNTLQGAVKRELAKDGCNFTDQSAIADWIVTINASSREYNQVPSGNQTLFFSYVDVTLSIEKGATGQIIWEDVLTEKGGHGLGYPEAAKAAYKKVTSKVCEILVNNINNQ